MKQSQPGARRLEYLAAVLPLFVALSAFGMTVETASDEGQEAFKVTTQSATYYYHKQGAGLSSIVDNDGVDWINFRQNPCGCTNSGCTGQDGCFRGIPNLSVCCHPGYPYGGGGGTGSQSSVTEEAEHKVTIQSTASNGAQTKWEFFETHAKLTVENTGGQPYWFLYEGTPYGDFSTSGDYFVRSDGQRQNCGGFFSGDMPSPEWIYFGDNRTSRVLFLAHHDDDNAPDTYGAMTGAGGGMTIFGFGRASGSGNKYLTATPNVFSLGFLEDNDYEAAKQQIGDIMSGAVAVGRATGRTPFAGTYALSRRGAVTEIIVNNSGGHTVELFDISGRRVWHAAGSGSTAHTLPINRIPGGSYVMRTRAGNKAVTRTLLIP